MLGEDRRTTKPRELQVVQVLPVAQDRARLRTTVWPKALPCAAGGSSPVATCYCRHRPRWPRWLDTPRRHANLRKSTGLARMRIHAGGNALFPTPRGHDTHLRTPPVTIRYLKPHAARITGPLRSCQRDRLKCQQAACGPLRSVKVTALRVNRQPVTSDRLAGKLHHRDG